MRALLDRLRFSIFQKHFPPKEGKSPLPFESAILNIVATELGGDAGRIALSQMEGIREVRRLGGWQYVVFEHRKDVPTFSLKRSSVRLAHLSGAVGGEPFSVAVSIIHGCIASLLFEKPIRHLLFSDDVTIESIQIEIDPMSSDTESPPDEYRGLVRDWSSRILQCRPPLKHDIRTKILKTVSVTLPDDYLDVIEQCEGFSTQGFSVFGAADIYDVDLPEGMFFLIAEILKDSSPCGYLGVAATANRVKVSFLPFDGDAIEVGSGLRESLEKAIGLV